MFVGVAQTVESGGLTRAGLADHQRDRVTRPGHPFDQLALLVGQSRPRLHRRGDRRVAGDADASVQALGGDVDGVGFEGEDLRCRAQPRQPLDRLPRRKVPVGAIQDLVEPSAVGGGAADGPDDVVASVGGVVLGDQPGQFLVGHRQHRHPRLGPDPGQVETEFSGPVLPPVPELVVREGVVFRAASGEGCDAGAVAGGGPLPDHRGFDLASPLAERPPHRVCHAVDLTDPVPVDRPEPEPRIAGKLVTKRSLKDGLGRVPDPVELPRVEPGEPTIGAATGVGHDQVAVQVRVTQPARPMIEARHQQPTPPLHIHSAMAPSHEARLGLQQLDDRRLGFVERPLDLPAGVVVAEGPGDRDRLRHTQRHIQRLHPGRMLREPPTTIRAEPLEYRSEVLRIDPARQAEVVGQSAVPASGPFGVEVVARRVVAADLGQVVVRAADLADRDHRPTARRRNAPLVHWCERSQPRVRCSRSADQTEVATGRR